MLTIKIYLEVDKKLIVIIFKNIIFLSLLLSYFINKINSSVLLDDKWHPTI